MTRVLICGGRHYGVADWSNMFQRLSTLHDKHYFTAIIEGGATGADAGAQIFGQQQCIPVETYKADWNTHGKAAGPMRNQRMLDEGKPDLVIAFPGGRGTADMVRRARKADVPITEVS